jgi:hypothetical protein
MFLAGSSTHLHPLAANTSIVLRWLLEDRRRHASPQPYALLRVQRYYAVNRPLGADVFCIDPFQHGVACKPFRFQISQTRSVPEHTTFISRCPTTADMAKKACERLAGDQIWVNLIAASRPADGKRSGRRSPICSRRKKNTAPAEGRLRCPPR